MTYTPVNPGGWPTVGDPDTDTVGDFILNQWGGVIVPKLQQGVTSFYDNVTGRTADQGSAPSYRTIAYTSAEKTLWVYDNGWQQLAQLATPWIAFTPTWRDGNGTVLQVNNGSITGRYQIVGKTIRFGVFMQRGSNSQLGASTTIGYTWDVPGGASLASVNLVGGTGFVYNNGATTRIPCLLEAVTGSRVALTNATSGSRIDTNTPGSWQASDTIKFFCEGEIV